MILNKRFSSRKLRTYKKMTEKEKLKYKARKQLCENTLEIHENKNRDISNSHEIEFSMPLNKLQQKCTKHDPSNKLVETILFRESDRKSKLSNKNSFYNPIKGENEMHNISEKNKAVSMLKKHETKGMNKNNSCIKETDILFPLIVLHHQKKKNQKRNSDKIIVHYKKPYTKFKTSSEKLISCKPLLCSKEQLENANNLYRDNNKIFTQGKHLAQTGRTPSKLKFKKSEKNETLVNNSNIKNSRHKQKIKRGKGLVCKNSLALLEAKMKKKRSIVNQQIVKEMIKVSTQDTNILTNDKLNKIKSQSIKIDSTHSVLVTPSRIAKILKYISDPNKYKSLHNGTITNVYRTKSIILNGKKDNKNIPPKINLEKHSLSKRLLELAVTKTDKPHYNPTPSESLLLGSYKNKTKKDKRKKDNNVTETNQRNDEYNDNDMRTSKCAQTKNKSLKDTLFQEHAATSVTADVKYASISKKHPKLSTIFSEMLLVKPNDKKSTYLDSSKTLVPDTGDLVDSTSDNGKPLKCNESYFFKPNPKKYKLKNMFSNRKLTEPCWNKEKYKNNPPLEVNKEFKELPNETEIKKVNLHTKENNCNLSLQRDHTLYFYDSRNPQNNLLFWPKLKNSLKITNSNKNILKFECSNKQLFDDECKEGNGIELCTNESTSDIIHSSISNKYQEDGINTDSQCLVKAVNSLKKIRDSVVSILPVYKDKVDISNKRNNTSTDEVFSVNETNKEKSRDHSPLLTKKCNLSEVGVQTDTLETVELCHKKDAKYSEKERNTGIDKCSTHVNKTVFCKNDNEAKSPFRRRSFVRIIVDEDKVNKNISSCVQSNTNSIEDQNNNNFDLPNNSTPENEETDDLNSEILQFVANESTKGKNQIIYKMNAVYEFLQCLEKILRDNGLIRLHGGCESNSVIGQFNNLLHCLCSNCLEIVNKIEPKTSNEKSKKYIDHSNIIEQSYFLSVDNVKSAKRHKFLKIIDDESLKIEREKQLNHEENKNMSYNWTCLNNSGISNMARKVEINSDGTGNLTQGESPSDDDTIHQLENKTQNNPKQRSTFTDLNNYKNPEILESTPQNNIQSISSSDKNFFYINKIETDTSVKNQFSPDDNQDNRKLFVSSIFERSSVNKNDKCCKKVTCGNWLGPVTPPTEKRRLFVRVVSEDCGEKIETHQETTEGWNSKYIGASISKQNLKTDREAFVVIVPSRQTCNEKNKDQSTHQKKDNLNTAGLEEEVTKNPDITEDYIDSLLLKRKIDNSEAQDVWWHNTYEHSQNNPRKSSQKRESSKIKNKITAKQKLCKDEIQSSYAVIKEDKCLKNNASRKESFSLGKQIVKHLYSESSCSLTRSDTSVCYHLDLEKEHRYIQLENSLNRDSRELPDCCLCFNDRIKSESELRKKYKHKQTSTNSIKGKVRHIANKKNHFGFCCSENSKPKQNTKALNEKSDNKDYNENDIYVPAFVMMVDKAGVVDTYLRGHSSEQIYSSSNEILQTTKCKVKESGCTLRKGYMYGDNNSLNNFENEYYSNKRHYNDMSSCKEIGDCIKCKNYATNTRVIPNLIEDSNYYNNDDLFKANKFINIFQTESCNNFSDFSFNSNLNCDNVNKSLTFTNKNKGLEHKSDREESKQFIQHTFSNSKLNLMKITENTQQSSKLHKIDSTENHISHNTQSNTKSNKKYSGTPKQISPFTLKEKESKFTISSFCTNNKPKVTQLKNNANKLNNDQTKNTLTEKSNECDFNKNSEVRNELDDADEWISLNKFDFQTSSLNNKGETDIIENKLGFKMEIKMSDMHVQFFCQPPYLNNMEKHNQ